MATVTGLFTAVTWGAGDWLTPRSKHKLGIFQISFALYVIGVIIFLPLLLMHFRWPTAKQTLEIIGSGTMLSFGYLSFVKALTEGAVGIVVPLSSIYPILTLFLSVILLGQSYTTNKVVAMLLIIAGAFLLAYERNHKKLPLRVLHRVNFYTLLAVLIWGFAFVILNSLITRVAWQPLVIIQEVVGLVVAFIFLIINYKQAVYTMMADGLYDTTTVAAGVLLALGVITLYVGAGRLGNIIIPSVLANVSPLISSLLAAIIDKEKLGWLKRAGALLAIGGIVILNIV